MNEEQEGAKKAFLKLSWTVMDWSAFSFHFIFKKELFSNHLEYYRYLPVSPDQAVQTESRLCSESLKAE